MNEMGMMQDDELIAQCLSMVKKLENDQLLQNAFYL